MAKTKYHPDRLSQFFQDHKIATMDQLKRALGTDVDLTVRRKLRPLSYRTSYSHRGRYSTLDSVAEFDEMGLWSFRSVHFSRHGTLIGTVRALVENSDAGFLARELENLLHVAVKDPLRKLVDQGRLAGQRISGQPGYCSAAPERRKQQLVARRIAEGRLLATPERGPEADEHKAAIVLFLSLLDEQQRRLYAGLESLRWGHGGDRKVADLLGMDVGTIARGRSELLAADVRTERVRRPGGGRKVVEKNARGDRAHRQVAGA